MVTLPLHEASVLLLLEICVLSLGFLSSMHATATAAVVAVWNLEQSRVPLAQGSLGWLLLHSSVVNNT